MWNYEKRLQYPVNISQTNPKLAQVIISQFGGPDGELAASMRYLSQRYTMPYNEVTGILTDIGREAPEMFHLKGLVLFFALSAGKLPAEAFPYALYPADNLCFCSCVAPFNRKQIQININIIFVCNHHFV